MPLHRQRAQKYLQTFDFESLFIEELGWDTVDRVTLPFEVDGEPFEVVSIAQKRGFTVFKCITPEIPTRPIRVKLDRQLTDYSKSHLLVFADEGKTQQIWMWVRQEPGKPLAPRFEQYQVGQSAERLLQKLEALAIAFAEEEKLTLVEVAQRVKKAFDVEKVTKKFFIRFEKEHGQFLKFIDGIQSEFDRTWYASLMLNRLMFVYFIQKKNFLDGDVNYLRNRLKRCQTEWGTDTFHSFYRQFLLKLFHEGLGKPDRNPELDQLLGKIPYLNGGLFEVHQLEEKYDSTLQISDAAFEQVFNFFDEYDWHLDDRSLRNQNEINPDVLGYIFEKYINQEEFGAYYTRPEITEYLCDRTINKLVLDRVNALGHDFDSLAALFAALEGSLCQALLHDILPTLTLLDPACGSGAFLVAAMKTLIDIYQQVVERARQFTDLLRIAQWLKVAAQHPSLEYYIKKRIITDNLYGVDIMEEATEIAKLRLFLALVSSAKTVKDLEPLPDIDFNIRAGNTLVGFASLDEVRKAIKQDGDQLKLDLQDDASRINEKAELADRAFQRFRQMQTDFGMNAGDFRTAKKELRRRLAELNEELNCYLAREHGVDINKTAAFEKWRDSHQPFHWFVEFYSIIDRGGFDVIIGNPPYLENTKLKSQYSISRYSTFQCGNIYTCVLEKAYELLSKLGKSGFIVPLSLVCTKRTSALRKVITPKRSWISCFDMRPSSLFEGVAQRLAIILSKNRHSNTSSVGSYRRWTAEERNHLIGTTAYTDINFQGNVESIAKLSSSLESRILEKISGNSLEKFVDEKSEPIYIHRIIRYFIKALSFIPLFIAADGNRGKSDDYKKFCFIESEREIIISLLNSSLFYWFWRTHSDGFHCGFNDVYLMPYNHKIKPEIRSRLAFLSQDLMKVFQDSSSIKSISTQKGAIQYQEFSPKSAKPIIDEIVGTASPVENRILAQHYGFTDEELDDLIIRHQIPHGARFRR